MWAIIFVINLCLKIFYCYSDQQRQTDDRYAVHLNGSSPQWQTSHVQNGKMFTVPTQLNDKNEIFIRSSMIDGTLDIKLTPDGGENNIVCRMLLISPERGTSQDQIIISNVINGNYNMCSDSNQVSDYFSDTSEIAISFMLSSSTITIHSEGNAIESIPLQHSIGDIRYISVASGVVKELGFKFA